MSCVNEMNRLLLLSCLVVDVFPEDSYLNEHTIGVMRQSYPPLLYHRGVAHFFVWTDHPDADVPESFDSRTRWPECESVGRIYDQGKCGMCWAVSSASVLTDRLCIFSKGRDTFEYSAEDMLNCCLSCTPVNGTNTNRCLGGGSFYHAIDYVIKEGAVSGGALNSNRGCTPLTSSSVEKGESLPCETKCTNRNYKVPYDEDKRFVDGATFIQTSVTPLAKLIKQVQLEIMANGPVLTSVYIPKSFKTSYTDEIYQIHNTSEPIIGHGVRLIGWGTENETPYWLIANSWGVHWGKLDGVFKIIRGKRFRGVEDMIWAPIFKQRDVGSPDENFYTSTKDEDGSRTTKANSPSLNCCVPFCFSNRIIFLLFLILMS